MQERTLQECTGRRINWSGAYFSGKIVNIVGLGIPFVTRDISEAAWIEFCGDYEEYQVSYQGGNNFF